MYKGFEIRTFICVTDDGYYHPDGHRGPLVMFTARGKDVCLWADTSRGSLACAPVPTPYSQLVPFLRRTENFGIREALGRDTPCALMC